MMTFLKNSSALVCWRWFLERIGAEVGYLKNKLFKFKQMAQVLVVFMIFLLRWEVDYR